MVRRFLQSLFGNGSAGYTVAEQQHVVEDERPNELEASKTALDALRHDLRLNGAELPTLAYSQFRQIDDRLSALITHIYKSGASTEQRVLLEAIVSDYLATSLRTYLLLPKSSRHEDSPESGFLFRQLATLYSTALDLDSQVRSGTATELAVHARFLQDKFDLSSLRLEGS